jgi:hypothetical protein
MIWSLSLRGSEGCMGVGRKVGGEHFGRDVRRDSACHNQRPAKHVARVYNWWPSGADRHGTWVLPPWTSAAVRCFPPFTKKTSWSPFARKCP